MKTKYQKSYFALLLGVVVFMIAFFSPFCVHAVRAEGLSAREKFEKRNVLEDLEGSEKDGVKFDINDYGFSPDRDTEIFSFVEFCYSFYADLQDDYGLYLYIYNPKGLRFNLNSSRNEVKFRVGKEIGVLHNENSLTTKKLYHMYHLQFINCVEDDDHYGLFYKFRVNWTLAQKEAILDQISGDGNQRVYRVIDVNLELAQTGELEHIELGQTFTYNGYAGGYGPSSEAQSTLTMNSEQCDYLSLKPVPVVYRPEGTNGKNNYTQDSLHSVYFSVPNRFLKDYGEMTAVHACWRDAVLNPMLITGNLNAYNEILPYLGTYKHSDLEYSYFGNIHGFSNPTEWLQTFHASFRYDWGYNYNYDASNDGVGAPPYTGYVGDNLYSIREENGKAIDTLYIMFNSGAEENSAKDYFISPELLTARMKASKDKFGGELVDNKYSRAIFESVAEKAEVEIHADYWKNRLQAEGTRPLTSIKIEKASWWSKLWGGKDKVHDYSIRFDNIDAIYKIKDTDLSGSSVDISEQLFVDKRQCDDLKTYWNNANGKETVYLFRYQVSDYISMQAKLFKTSSGAYVFDKEEDIGIDNNAFFTQETVNLDFNIIDVTFSNGKVDTVFPVAMKPIDVIPGLTPPVYWKSSSSDGGAWSWLKWVLLAIILLVVFVILWMTGLLPYLLKGIGWAICLPFRLIAAPFKRKKAAANPGGGQSPPKNTGAPKKKAVPKRKKKKPLRKKRE